jgi:GMP synthase-like glutamine amidotransferase
MTRCIGIIETGAPPPAAQRTHGSYVDMFQRALGPHFTYSTYDARANALPNLRDGTASGFLITGSASGVADPDAWIQGLGDWLRALDADIPLVGICFGHQLMAEIAGGKVARAVEGWSVGLQSYLTTDESEIVLPAAHRDHVVRIPRGARVIARNESCPVAALHYSNRRAISFQAHPEFSRDYAWSVVERCEAKGLIDEAKACAGRASFELVDDCATIIGAIRHFLDSGQVHL